MGTMRWAAARPFLWALLWAPFAACSCDDRLVAIDFPEPHVPPELPEGPLDPDRPELGERILAVFPEDGAGCDGAPASLGVQVFGGVPPYRYSWDASPELADTTAARTVATGFGTKDFFVTVTDAAGEQVRARVTVSRLPRPTPAIDFAQGAREVCAGNPVVLDGRASRSADGSPPAAFSWDVDGDGVEDERAPTTAELVPVDGQPVRLTVTDVNGCTAAGEVLLGVRPLPTPAVAFLDGGERSCAGETVALSAASSRDADGNPVVAYEWDIDGDGRIDRTTAATGTFVPSASGTARLTVADAEGCRSSVTQALDVAGRPTAVIAFASGNGEVCTGDAVALDGSGSRTAAGDASLAYAWDLDGNPATIESTAATPPPFSPAGPRTVRLTVTDGLGCTAAATRPVSVRALPTPAIAFRQGAATTCAGTPVALDASGSAAAGGGNLTFAWDVNGDGTVDGTGPGYGPFTPADGQTLRLAVRDEAGCEATAVQPFTTLAGPTAAIAVIGSGKLCDGEPVQLDGSASRNAGGGPVASYAWDRDGDGTTDEATPITSPFAPTAGVKLTVADANACVATATRTIPVLGPRQLYPFASTPGTGTGVVDIIFVIDNSGSMGEEIEAVENNINVNFADIIQASQIDYRIILISKHGRSSQLAICVRSPLSGTTCQPKPPNRPANTSRFFHYDAEVGSWNSLELILSTYNRPDVHGFAPNGWSGWLRPNAQRVFVEITDDESNLSASAFETALLALSPANFGTAQHRNYVFLSIVGLAKNTPATRAWEPADPIQTARCGTGSMAPGIQYQELSRRTGGLRFPICEYASFDAVFEAIAGEVIEDVLACELALPAIAPDPDTLEVEYTPGDGSGIRVLERVATAGSCTGAGGFYLDGGTVRLCPAACAEVQADPGADLALSGCGP